MACKNYFIFVVIISRHFVFHLHSFLRVFILCAWADFACQSAYFFICFSRAYTRFAITKHCFVFCATVVAIVMLPLCAFQCSSMRTWGPAEAETTKPKKLTKNCLAMTNIFFAQITFCNKTKKDRFNYKVCSTIKLQTDNIVKLDLHFFRVSFCFILFFTAKTGAMAKSETVFHFSIVLLFCYSFEVSTWLTQHNGKWRRSSVTCKWHSRETQIKF